MQIYGNRGKSSVAAVPQKRGSMERIAKFYPPGYEWQDEWKVTGCLLGLAFVLSWQYLFRLVRMTNGLYWYEGGKRFVRAEVIAESYMEVVGNSWLWFLLPIVFLALMAVWHYASYWQYTRSIYVMRRLPRRGVVLASCVQGPLLCAAVLALAAVLLSVLYLGLYWIAVPAECMPRLY